MGNGDHNAGGNLAMDFNLHPIRGDSNILSCFMLQKPELIAGADGGGSREKCGKFRSIDIVFRNMKST